MIWDIIEMHIYVVYCKRFTNKNESKYSVTLLLIEGRY